ncbi:hypothetical protein E4656_17430 [Natronospirillum operosum]|uniref:Uncharacterized protein n=1 Tax=Natronospirillum operosum TaxID=2759953 RepID=A0A4Z0W7K8_9GAMM|nr:hypothetical protein [Natronospirillum operosum]TGG90718.1 hypothetical protein E4656_17430 [Natronospirillum operosum]
MNSRLRWVFHLCLGYGALFLVVFGGAAFVMLDSGVPGLHPGIETALFVLLAGSLAYIGVYLITSAYTQWRDQQQDED